MDYSPPGYLLHGIFQARILEWVAISFSRGYCQLRDQTWVSLVLCICLSQTVDLGSRLIIENKCDFHRSCSVPRKISIVQVLADCLWAQSSPSAALLIKFYRHAPQALLCILHGLLCSRMAATTRSLKPARSALILHRSMPTPAPDSQLKCGIPSLTSRKRQRQEIQQQHPVEQERGDADKSLLGKQ